MFGFLQICLEQAKHVCKLPHICILADVWLSPIMHGKHQTRWYIYTWVLFPHTFGFCFDTHVYTEKGTHVWKRPHNYVDICKCWAFSTHVLEKPLTCFFPLSYRWLLLSSAFKHELVLSLIFASWCEFKNPNLNIWGEAIVPADSRTVSFPPCNN